MLLTKTIKMRWNPKHRKFYESNGYIFTKWNEEFEVKVEDLPKYSIALVEVKCDCKLCKSPNLKPMEWQTYKRYLRDNGEYYCRTCASTERIERGTKTKLLKSKSFEQWCVENNRQDVLDRWDYELNDKKPSEISYGTKEKYYFKCEKNLHDSELKLINSFTSGHEGSIKCNKCNSIAQFLIDEYGENALELYWDYDKNNKLNNNPWKISKKTDRIKIWIRCQQKDYHGSYQIRCNDFVNGDRCGYCSNKNGKVHPLDSLGSLYPEVLKIWSEKNKKSCFEFAPLSNQKVWWKCSERIHDDYLREISASNTYDFRCPECQFSQGETAINIFLNNSKIFRIPQKGFDGLVGVGNGNLSYDFYLPQHNLLIEYQGEFHDGTAYQQSEEEFAVQQEHDRRKRQYAEDHKIKLLEIWYWDFDNIESILKKELNIDKELKPCS